MSIMKEFKAFAMRGNVADMAVGIVIGAAFGKIVSSLVADIIMPPIGMMLGKINFSDLAVTLKEAGNGAAAVTLNYGKFVQSLVDFIIVAFAIFMVIKGMNALKKEHEEAPQAAAAPSREEQLLTEIRDALKKN
jgi:large conductance mechanosensitive channel